MFNDKITKKIAESAKKVLEANEEVPPVPPVVAGRLPASALPKKKVTRKVEKNPPVVRLGQGDYQKDYTEKNLGPVVDVKDIASKISKRVMGIIRPKKN